MEIFQLQMDTQCTGIDRSYLDLRKISHPIGGASKFSGYLNS